MEEWSHENLLELKILDLELQDLVFDLLAFGLVLIQHFLTVFSPPHSSFFDMVMHSLCHTMLDQVKFTFDILQSVAF